MKTQLLFFALLGSSVMHAQTITWTDITASYSVPAGITITRGDRASPTLKLFSIDVDLNNTGIVVRPYLSTVAGGKETAVPFLQRVGALAGVNGGYFGGSTSYSAVVYPGEVAAQNIASVSRSAGTYYVTRSFFGVSTARKPAIDWIYHFGGTPADLYRYSQPTANTQTTPAAAPVKAGGVRYDSLLAGIGGGPRLIKNGLMNYTYDEEVFFGSGVDGELANPRTAVGYTAARHVILLAADGRQTNSAGVTLPELAQIMLDLGCVDAMNLDGGGSTQMAARTPGGYQYVDVPSESRAVPTVLAVVYSDSLAGAKVPTFEKIIDTGDTSLCTLSGGGWFASANPTWWGTTPAQLAPVGSGDKTALFRLSLPRSASYDLQAWWVASSNRSTTTPVIVRHKNGTDTVRVDQSINGSRWCAIGSYTFRGDSGDAVIISNAAGSGSYVCADAIKLVSYDPSMVSVAQGIAEKPTRFRLRQNYPNPFNPTTTIPFDLGKAGGIDLRLYDVLGREVMLLAEGEFPAGAHRVVLHAQTLASGMYVCRLLCGSGQQAVTVHLVR